MTVHPIEAQSYRILAGRVALSAFGAGAAAVAARAGDLTVVDGSFLAFLRGCEPRSIDCFALSNICEWMTPAQIEELFGEVLRTAAPGARLCFRNFVGWTELPRGCDRITVDAAAGLALSRTDRSLVQPRIVVCRIREVQ